MKGISLVLTTMGSVQLYLTIQKIMKVRTFILIVLKDYPTRLIKSFEKSFFTAALMAIFFSLAYSDRM